MLKSVNKSHPLRFFVFFQLRYYSQTKFKELHPVLITKIEKYAEKLRALESSPSSGLSFNSDNSKKLSRLSSILNAYTSYKNNITGYLELQQMMQDANLKQEAEKEAEDLLPILNQSYNVLISKLLPSHPFADKPCMLELRPGVGGIEAMIFTQDLLDMYVNYAQFHGWKCSVVSKTKNASGSGIVEAILTIDEPGAYDKLKYEAGVHRVQRIPKTDSKGRTHTSTAAVVVLPQIVQEADISVYERTFKPNEIRIDVMRAGGKGGQHVNTTDSAVRLTHYPSGIVIHMQEERSQHRNKTKAFQILRARLAEIERLQKEERERNVRKDQVSSTNRCDKIRTYNYSQNRVTDHRCNFTLHDLTGFMAGERLDDLVRAIADHDIDLRAKSLLDISNFGV